MSRIRVGDRAQKDSIIKVDKIEMKRTTLAITFQRLFCVGGSQQKALVFEPVEFGFKGLLSVVQQRLSRALIAHRIHVCLMFMLEQYHE